MQNKKSRIISSLKNTKTLGTIVTIIGFGIGTYAFQGPPVGCTPESCSSPLDVNYATQTVTVNSTPTASGHVANKSYVDTAISAIPASDLTSVLERSNDADGNRIANLGTPVSNTDASTKAYVDTVVSAAGEASGSDWTGFSTSNLAFSEGGIMNFCSQLSGDNGSISAINNNAPCNYNYETDEMSKCWNGACLEEDNGGQRYCRSYNFSTGTWNESNNSNICESNKYCSAGYCHSPKIVFVTNATYTGNLGGISGANAKCQSEANAAGLAGTYKAWISATTSSDPESTFTRNPYKLVNNSIVAHSWADLTDGNIDRVINLDANGNNVTGYVWTNTNTNGSHISDSYDCTNWSNGSSGSGYYGYTIASNSGWSSSSVTGCSNTYHLYCFEQ